MNMNVGSAGNSCDARLELLGNLEIWPRIAAGHLHINRSWQAEIENLIGDVCRFEENHRIGEFLVQSLAEPIGVKRGRGVFRLERDKNVAITGPDGWTVAESQIEPAVGKADVIEDRVKLIAGNHVPDPIFNIGKK